MISGTDFRNMILNAAAAIRDVKQEINELNVFPVPDGDTGTNMTMTMEAAAAQLTASAPEHVGQAAAQAAAALLRGARGNSGVILSLLFRGVAKSLKEKRQADAMEFAQALTEGVGAAYRAVMKPAEGTILTVSRVAANAAAECAADETDVELVLEHAIRTGYEALAETVHQNPVLQKAGVVDAGAKGYLIILEGMHRALQGVLIENAPEQTAAPRAEKADFSAFRSEEIRFAYCTEFIVSRENAKDPDRLRGFLDGIGDSAVVVEDDALVKVHVHTNAPGAVLTEALTYGALLTVKIENMKEQHTEALAVEPPAKQEGQLFPTPEKNYGAVVVSAGQGLDEVFRDLGADRIITGGQTMNPSTEDIIKAIERTPAKIVYVLPNNKNIIMAAQQCVPLSEKRVVIIPTKTIPQGIMALLALESDADEAENTARMTEAAQAVRTAQITYASRDSVFDGRRLRSGEYLALLENDLLGSGGDIEALIRETAAAIKPLSPEIVTIFYGQDVEEQAAARCAEIMTAALPEAEVNLVWGGQPVYYYYISVE